MKSIFTKLKTNLARKNKHKQKGFTLIELSLVIAVIGIVFTLMFSKFGSSIMANARVDQIFTAESNFKQILDMFKSCGSIAVDSDGYFTDLRMQGSGKAINTILDFPGYSIGSSGACIAEIKSRYDLQAFPASLMKQGHSTGALIGGSLNATFLAPAGNFASSGFKAELAVTGGLTESQALMILNKFSSPTVYTTSDSMFTGIASAPHRLSGNSQYQVWLAYNSTAKYYALHFLYK